MRITRTTVRVRDAEEDGAALLGTTLEHDLAGPFLRIGWTVVRPAASTGTGIDRLAILDTGDLILELIAHAGHRDATAGREARPLGVCEVGVAVPDVEGAIVGSGPPVFADTAAHDFPAIGGRDGRIILAAPGRVRSPAADRVAGTAPVVISMEGVAEEVLLGDAHLLPS